MNKPLAHFTDLSKLTDTTCRVCGAEMKDSKGAFTMCPSCQKRFNWAIGVVNDDAIRVVLTPSPFATRKGVYTNEQATIIAAERAEEVKSSPKCFENVEKRSYSFEDKYESAIETIDYLIKDHGTRSKIRARYKTTNREKLARIYMRCKSKKRRII